MPLLRAINSSYHGVEFNKLEHSIGKFTVPKLLHWQVHLVTITLTSFCECVFIHPNQCKKTLKQEFRKALEVSYPNCVWAGPGTVFLKVTFRSNVVSGQTDKSILEIMLHNQENVVFEKRTSKHVCRRMCVRCSRDHPNLITRVAAICTCVRPGRWWFNLTRNVHLATLKQTISDRFFEHSWICWILQCCAGSNCSIMP